MQTTNAQVIGDRYQVIRRLGGGGQKTVYLAEDLRLNRRRCALAEMIDNFTDLEEQKRAVAAFQREADMLASLHDEHIPQIYDKFSEGQSHYLVMEFVEGGTLEEKLRAAGGRLGELEVVNIGLQILETLDYLHSLNPPVIYRDMKPGNVMIADSGKVKLIDFGIARFFQSTRMTTFGTVGYAPKEQYSGMVEPRSDLYALGATLHEALSGRAPMPFDFPPLFQLRPGCNELLSDLLVRALADDIEQRIPNAREFRNKLLRIKGELTHPSSSVLQPAVGNDDRTVSLHNMPTQSDRETLVLTAGMDAPTAILQASKRTRIDGERTLATLSSERRLGVDSEAKDASLRKGSQHRSLAFFLAACTAGVTLAATGGFYAWNQMQERKAALAAHEKAMDQLEEEERAIAEQQRLNELKREQELLQQQAALRQQELEREAALQQQELRRQQAALRERALKLEREQQAAVRERQSHQTVAGAPHYPSPRYPASGYSGSRNAYSGYPTPAGSATPVTDSSNAVAAGLSAAIGGAIGSSIGELINHHH
jgi:serine/threonine protein kinase